MLFLVYLGNISGGGGSNDVIAVLIAFSRELLSGMLFSLLFWPDNHFTYPIFSVSKRRTFYGTNFVQLPLSSFVDTD